VIAQRESLVGAVSVGIEHRADEADGGHFVGVERAVQRSASRRESADLVVALCIPVSYVMPFGLIALQGIPWRCKPGIATALSLVVALTLEGTIGRDFSGLP
jgi:hypothetical protein